MEIIDFIWYIQFIPIQKKRERRHKNKSDNVMFILNDIEKIKLDRDEIFLVMTVKVMSDDPTYLF